MAESSEITSGCAALTLELGAVAAVVLVEGRLQAGRRIRPSCVELLVTALCPSLLFGAFLPANVVCSFGLVHFG